MSQSDFAGAFPVRADGFLTHNVQVAVVEVELEGLANGIEFVEPGVMKRNHLTKSNSNNFLPLTVPMVSNATL